MSAPNGMKEPAPMSDMDALLTAALELAVTELYRRWLERRITFGLVENERLLWQILEGRLH